MAAGVATACLVGASFVPSPSLDGSTQICPRGGVSAAPALQGAGSVSGAGQAAAALTAAGALGATLVAAGRRRGWASRIPSRAKVLTTDDEGRFRFDVAMPALVPSEQPGAVAPMGFFDPLGFTRDPLMTFKGDPNGFKHLREAEIKHGRVAMMAATGSVMAKYVKMPGFEDVPTGLAALNTSTGAAGFSVLLLGVGLLEAWRWKNPMAPPGSYGDPFSFGQYTEEMRNKELNNGRMAMFAVTGQLVAELATGLDPVQQFGV